MRKPGRDRERIGPLTNIFADLHAWTVCIVRGGKYHWATSHSLSMGDVPRRSSRHSVIGTSSCAKCRRT